MHTYGKLALCVTPKNLALPIGVHCKGGGDNMAEGPTRGAFPQVVHRSDGQACDAASMTAKLAGS